MGDGHLGKCKTCAKRDVAERAGRLANNPKWLAKERERCRKKQERYRLLGIAAKPSDETRQKWHRNNKHKVKAQHKAHAAYKRGEILKPESCNRCGISGVRLEKHHEDYSKPLNVEWLCTKCHGKTRRLDVLTP